MKKGFVFHPVGKPGARLIWAEEVQLHVASKLEKKVPCFLSYSGVHHEGFCVSVHLLCMFISSTGSCSYSYEWAVLESVSYNHCSWYPLEGL